MRTDLQLVGRDPELRTLLRILPDTGLGLPRAAAVFGEPGIGKTHLLTKFASRARGRGFDVLTARGRPGTATVPAGTLLDVLPAAPPVGDEGSVLWWVRNTLVGHSENLVVLMDDAHLADPLSLAVCDHLADSGRVAVVVAARSTEPEPTGLTHFATSDGVHRVRLGPLDVDATSALVQQIEGCEVSDNSVQEVHRLTNGVPLVVRELVRAAGDAGAGVAGAEWQWDQSIAGDPRLASLFSSRLSHVPDETIRVLWLLVAADGPIPESAAVAGISASAASDAVARGLLVLEDGWLGWSHPLLGELAVESLTGNRTTAARSELISGLRQSNLGDPEVLSLAATLDLKAASPDPDLQLAAANAAAARGLHAEAAAHAQAAVAVRRDDHDACVSAALAAISTNDPDLRQAVRRALDTAATSEQLLETTQACVLRLFGACGDAPAAFEIIADAKERTDDYVLRSRLENVKIQVALVALPPEEFLPMTFGLLESGNVDEVGRTAIQATLSIILSAVGEIDQATAFAAPARSSEYDTSLSVNREAGYYGGAMAALFAGDALTASRLVTEGSETLKAPPGTDADISHRSLRCTIGAQRGHCNVGMPAFVQQADAVGSLRYGVMNRICSVWELALRCDPDADRYWQELQDAPLHLRQGPAFLEAFAGVALQASHGDVDGAADTALGVAEMMAPARSAAAWLLHDAARHDRANEVVDQLDAIAATQPGRYLPAVFADSARAIATNDPDQLTTSGSELRSGGFDLFAAELDVLASSALHADRKPTEAGHATRRARTDLERAGNPWTPIIGRLEASPLTDRQREICSLVVNGMTNAQIAEQLGISKRTVENQLHRAYAELGVDRAGLANARF